MSDQKRGDETIQIQTGIEEPEQQPNEVVEKLSNQLAMVGASNERSEGKRPQIFKLDVNYQEILDWVSINDIFSVAQTCTQIKQTVVDYFQPNLITFVDEHYYGILDKYKGYNVFSEFGKELLTEPCFNDEDYPLSGLHYKSLKRLTFVGMQRLNANNSEYIKQIECKIESLAFL